MNVSSCLPLLNAEVHRVSCTWGRVLPCLREPCVESARGIGKFLFTLVMIFQWSETFTKSASYVPSGTGKNLGCLIKIQKTAIVHSKHAYVAAPDERHCELVLRELISTRRW